jgi:hypothetical protein
VIQVLAGPASAERLAAGTAHLSFGVSRAEAGCRSLAGAACLTTRSSAGLRLAFATWPTVLVVTAGALPGQHPVDEPRRDRERSQQSLAPVGLIQASPSDSPMIRQVRHGVEQADR